MSRQVRQRYDLLFAQAERRGMCLVPHSASMRRQLSRLTERGQVISPRASLYARAEHWQRLTPAERVVHEVRALAAAHPDWIFCDVTAALLHGLAVSNRHLGTLHVVTTARAHSSSRPGLERHVIKEDAFNIVNGIRVTSLERTVLDCLRHLDFRHGLAIADSALRITNGTSEQLMADVKTRGRRLRGIQKALATASHASGLSESGGESIARATMIEQGFLRPELQITIADPINRWHRYRVDFLWTLADGTRIAGELDGREKYRNPAMTGGRDALDVLADERLRESRISATGIRVVRFSYSDVSNVPFFVRLLEGYGIPRPLAPVGTRPGQPLTGCDPERLRLAARTEVMFVDGWTLLVTTESHAA